MKQFLGLSVEQTNHCISLHHGPYNVETIEEYQKIIGKAIRPIIGKAILLNFGCLR
jgi:hypothetical protein